MMLHTPIIQPHKQRHAKNIPAFTKLIELGNWRHVPIGSYFNILNGGCARGRITVRK